MGQPDYRKVVARLRADAELLGETQPGPDMRVAADALDLLAAENERLKRELDWESDPNAIDYRAIVEDADTVTVVEVSCSTCGEGRVLSDPYDLDSWEPCPDCKGTARRCIIVGSEDVIRERLADAINDWPVGELRVVEDQADRILVAITKEDTP